MTQLGIAILWCVAQVTAMTLVTAGLYLFLRRRGPTSGALVAIGGLAAVSLLSVLALSPWPCWWAVPSDSETTVEVASVQNDITTEGQPSSQTTDGNLSQGQELVANPAAFDFWQALLHEMTLAPAPSASAGTAWRWQAIAALLLLVISASGILYLMSGMLSVRQILRLSKPIDDTNLWQQVERLRTDLECGRPIEIRQSSKVFTAAVAGWLRPVILLSPQWRSWSNEQRQSVLAHELAHLVRGDCLSSLLAQFAVAIHFYHPLVHWLTSRLRLEQELAADALAAPLAGGRQNYLRSLAEMALRQDEHLLGWPARCFLPTRGTLIRRIEMLRDSKHVFTGRSMPWKVLGVGLLLLAVLAVAGLRSPSGYLSLPVIADEQKAAQQRGHQPFDQTFIGDSGSLVIAIKPAAILSNPNLKALSDVLIEKNNEYNEMFGISPDKMEQVILTSPRIPFERKNSAFGQIYIQSTEPHQWKRFGFVKDFSELPELSYRDKKFRNLDKPRPEPGTAFYQPDERSLVFARVENIKRYIDGRQARKSLLKSEAWKEVENDHVALIVGSGWFREQIFSNEVGKRPGVTTAQNALHASIALYAPLWEEANTIAVGITADEKLKIRVLVYCDDQQGAKEVAETVKAVIVLGRNSLKQLKKDFPLGPLTVNLNRTPSARPDTNPMFAIYLQIQMYEQLLGSVQVKQQGSLVTIEATTDLDGKLLAPLSQAISKARWAAHSSQSKNNLKMIALAMHNYHDAYRHFPPAVVMGPDGKTPHSWRVELLPFLDQAALHSQYEMNEPWDSPSNLKVLAKMPDLFRHPQADKGSTSSSYYALVGPGTAFSKKEGVRIQDIRDGTSNSLLVVEAKRDIPWTKPEDIDYDSKKPLPELGGYQVGEFSAAFCDGSVKVLQTGEGEEKLLRALISIAGREVIEATKDQLQRPIKR